MKKIALISVVILSFTLLNFVTAFACEGTIRGEVTYSGGMEGNVIVAAFNFQLDFENFDFDLEDSFILDTLAGPGMYEFTALDGGTYLVAAFMDVNEDGLPGFIEPLGAYPGTVELSDSGEVNEINIDLNELPRGNSSISGAVHYDGELTGKIHVFALGFTTTPFNFHCPYESNNYTISGLMPGEYLVVAFLDVDDNGIPDLGEPLGFIEDKVKVGNSEEITEKDITLFDPGSFTGSITGAINYSGSSAGNIYIYTVGMTHTPITITEVSYPETSYEVTNLAQGEYQLFAYLDADSSGSYDPMGVDLSTGFPQITMGEPYQLIADPIVLGEAEHNAIDLTLNEQGDAGISGTITYNGDQQGFLVLAAAIGLSPSWLGIGQAVAPVGATEFSYTIPNLDAGLYGIIGIMITDYSGGFDDFDSILKNPIGFYTKGLVCVASHDTVPDIDFCLEDSTTATSSITGTLITPEGLEGDIHLFSLGISLTYWPEIEITENTYTIPDLRSGRYFIGGFMDVNGDGKFDMDEPVAFTESLVEIPHGDTVVVVNLNFNYNFIIDINDAAQSLSPDKFMLAKNYPNPFNPTTNIQYQLAESRNVSIKIYNMLGNEVKTLINEEQPAGLHQITWDGKNSNGNNVSSGVYLYCMKAGDYVSFKKMTLIR